MKVFLVGIVFVYALVVAGIVAAAEHKTNYKVSRLGVQDVAVSCYNGQEPVVTHLGHNVVVSCDAE